MFCCEVDHWNREVAGDRCQGAVIVVGDITAYSNGYGNESVERALMLKRKQDNYIHGQREWNPGHKCVIVSVL